ncbi:MAG: hypothetical protein M1829_000094 [Trizodia sp. TS-e1964]|nr:MAG: hypothetical protein M1829_000094 [Trizodia sp. TS-e1964]
MAAASMVDPAIFERLQSKIDEDTHVREELRGILQILERQGRATQSILSRAHSTPSSELSSVISSAEVSLQEEIKTVALLSKVASRTPYYKYNAIWTREIQNSCFSILLCGWLGGYSSPEKSLEKCRLLTIEEVGQIFDIPVNLKTQDAFHLTIEEYLQSLITLIEELTRLAINSVTMGDYQRPLEISQFVKDLHSGFQILNLKNDSLRRRSDSIKYNIKKIEDVVYDLSLRNLIPGGKNGEKLNVAT